MYFLIIQCNHSGIGEVSDFIFSNTSVKIYRAKS